MRPTIWGYAVAVGPLLETDEPALQGNVSHETQEPPFAPSVAVRGISGLSEPLPELRTHFCYAGTREHLVIPFNISLDAFRFQMWL